MLPFNLHNALLAAKCEMDLFDIQQRVPGPVPKAESTKYPGASTLPPDQIKQQLRQRGETITAWASKHGYRRAAVYRVLNGQEKGFYGQAHEIAVKLGMKPASTDGMAA